MKLANHRKALRHSHTLAQRPRSTAGTQLAAFRRLRRSRREPQMHFYQGRSETTMAKQLEGKRIAFLAADGFEQSELEQPWNDIKNAGATVELLSVHKGSIQGMRHMDKGDSFEVDGLVAEADAANYDGLV